MSVKIKGIVKSGIGESSGYMSRYIPWLFPGTLNILLNESQPSINYEIVIHTDYGPCKLSRCKINDEFAYIFVPPVRPDNLYYLEIAATFNIREKFNIVDKDIVIVDFLI